MDKWELGVRTATLEEAKDPACEPLGSNAGINTTKYGADYGSSCKAWGSSSSTRREALRFCLLVC